MEKRDADVSPKPYEHPASKTTPSPLPTSSLLPPKIAPTTKPLEVFIVCSRERQDIRLCTKLEQGLSHLCRAEVIKIWHEEMIVPGTERQQEIDVHLEQSALILLLLSQPFFASEACYNMLQKVREKQPQKNVSVIPIILRPCDWEEIFKTVEVLPTNRIPITSWSDPDQAVLHVTRGIRRVIDELTTVPSGGSYSTGDMSATGQRSVLPAQWNVPYRRNLFFTGRESVLTSLHEMLVSQKRAALTQALTGLGGIGKTQTAVEYAYRYQHMYTAVFWARADSREALTADFVAIADLLDLPTDNEQDHSRVAQAVRQWFNTHADWLLIIDNIEEIESIADFLPQGSAGHILFTTRAQSVGTGADPIAIEKMQITEGALFLLRRAKRIRLDAPVDAASDVEQAKAREISAMMDGLPLALDQAGAYIEETGCGLARYLELFQQRRAELLKRRGKSASGHAESVTTTFSLCFEKVVQTNAAAAELLRCCALLYPDNIPEEIFTEAAVELGPLLQRLATDPFLFDEAIAELLHYSLLHRNTETQMLSIHRLVQAVLVDEMEESLQHLWAERVVKALHKVFPFPGHQPATWQSLQRYLTQAQICVALIERWNIRDLDVAHWLFHVGHAFANSGFYALSEQFYLQGNTLVKNNMSQMIEALFGMQGAEYVASSPAMETLTGMSPLPLLYYQQGKYDQAEVQLQRVIAFIESILGPEHMTLVEYLNMLGALYSTTGNYAEAEACFQRSLTIRLRAPSTDFDGLATSLNNLADLYRRQGKYDQAEPFYQQALQRSEKQFGSDHVKVAPLLHNLALLYRTQKKYPQAEILYQRALSIYEHAYGPENPSLATVLNSLGALYAYQEKDAEAEPLLLKALAVREKVLGTDHADVGRTLNNLGNIYLRQGKYDQAEQILQRSLKIYTNSLGPEHLEVAMPLVNLGQLYSRQGKYEQAETSLERALTIYERAVGLQSPDAIGIFQELVIVYAEQKKALPIQMICRRMLPALIERFGAHHEHVRSVQNLLLGLSQWRRNQANMIQKPHTSSLKSKRNKKWRKK